MKLNCFFSILLSASLALSLTACQDDKVDNKTTQTENNGDNNNGDNNNGDNNENNDKPTDPKAAADAAKDAETYLASCDFAKASELLDTAYNADKTNADIAFQHAILGLINLVNHKSVQPILKDFGFTGDKVDFSYAWQTDGVFKQMLSGSPNWDDLYNKIPHPTVKEDKPFADSISDSLTFASVINALNAMDADLSALANSLETAAKSLDGGKLISIDKAGCSLNEIKFSASDLYFMAAVIRVAMAATDLAGAYDLDISIKKLLKLYDEIGDEDGWIRTETEADANTECATFTTKAKFIADHLLKVKTADAGKEGRKHLAAAAAALKNAANAAANAPAGAFFGWNTIKEGVYTDLVSVSQKIIDSNDGASTFSIALITPTLNFDLTKLFDNAIAPSKPTGALCTINAWKNCTDIDPVTYECTNVTMVYDVFRYPISFNALRDFLYLDIINTVTSTKLFDNFEDEECADYCKNYPDDCVENECIYMDIDPKYSHSFSTAWKSFDPNEVFNVNNRFFVYNKDE